MSTPKWTMKQNWMEAFFINTPVAKEKVAPLLPRGVELDLYDGQAWISVIPFHMREVGFRLFPWYQFREFPEVNIRTYVTDGKKPGVVFISLDSTHRLFNSMARTFVKIPYVDSSINYQDQKINLNREGFSLQLEAAPRGESIIARGGSFEHWIAERYCFYNTFKGRTCRWDVDHEPWPIQKTETRALEIQHSILILMSRAFATRSSILREFTPKRTLENLSKIVGLKKGKGKMVSLFSNMIHLH